MKNTKMAQVITDEITLEFVDPKSGSPELSADLTFNPADPYAVTVLFRTGVEDVAWTFGRDLLIEGLYEPSGDGDVHVWPCLSANGSAVVIIELSSPDGEVLVQTNSRPITQFVTRMLESVPEGHESSYLDLDNGLQALLSV